ncbi:MAG: dihydrodipicolinate synthase family protein [Puniceicoccaceae bacterium]
MQPIPKTKGFIAAPFTPFDQDHNLDLSKIPAYVEWLTSEDVSGAFVCGTTGEGPSLTTEERIRVAEAWMNAASNGLRIIVHVGHNSLTEAQLLAEHAESIQAGAIGCMPPQFFAPRNVDEVADCCAEVAAAAPNTPFYYYHMPSMSGVSVNVADLLPILENRIPTFVGVKFTYEDIDDYRNCRQYESGRYDILFGRDEKLLTAIEAGCTGAVGSTYNFAAPIYFKIFDAYQQGDMESARILQETATAMIDTCISGSWHPIAGFKSIMQLVGLDCGPVRLPLPPIKESEKNQLEYLLKDLLESDLIHHFNR